MLGSKDPEVQCAAAKVLGELRPNAGGVYHTMGEALKTKNHLLRVFILEAFKKAGFREGLPYLLPLIDEGDQLRSSVIVTLVAMGHESIKDFQKTYKTGTLPVKLAMVESVVRQRGKAATEFLLEVLRGGDLEVVRQTADLIADELPRFEAKDRRALEAGLAKLLSKGGKQQPQPLLIAALKLLGQLRDPSSRNLILSFTKPDQPTEVRVQALHALLGMDLQGGDQRLLVRTLMSFLREEDFTHIVSNVVKLLEAIVLPKAYLSALLAELENPYPQVQFLVIQALGRFDTPQAAQGLMRCLHHADYRIREEASRALQVCPSAAPLILAQLFSDDEINRRWTLAKLLIHHRDHLDGKARKKLMDRLLSAVDRDEPDFKLYLSVMKRLDLPGLSQALLARAKRHKTGQKFDQAERYLRLLESEPEVDPRFRFELGLARLKLSPQSLTRAQRDTDPALEIFQDIVRGNSVDLAKLVFAEKKLSPEDVFYLGFHFSERVGPEREFGTRLLRHVATRFARRKVASKAKAKLDLEGIGLDA